MDFFFFMPTTVLRLIEDLYLVRIGRSFIHLELLFVFGSLKL